MKLLIQYIYDVIITHTVHLWRHPHRRGKKGAVEEAEYSEYSESGSEYSEYSEEQPQPDYYEMDEQPPQGE